MSLLDKLLSPLTKLFKVEAPRPKLAISEKSKTDIALPFIVGNDYIKLEPAISFKRDNEQWDQVGIVNAWCTGPVDVAVQKPQLYVSNTPATDPKYRFNSGTSEASLLASTTRGGGPNTPALAWPDFLSIFGYQSDMYGRGVVHSAIKYHKDPEVFDSDPSADFWLKVRKGNCRRTDGTANGLSDSWADNPFAVIQWYIDDTMVGMGRPAMFGDSFADSIQWLENNLVTQDGVDKKRFTVNGAVSTDKDYGEVLKIFEKHCHSKISFIEGKFEIATKGRVTAPFLDLNKSNIDGKIEVEPASAQDAYTQVQVSWINPDKNFEKDFVLYPETNSAEDIAERSQPNYIENLGKFDLELCNNHAEAFEFARIKYWESKDKVGVKLTAHAEASQLIPYDVVSITDPKRTWDAKLFLVEKSEEKNRNGIELYDLELSALNPTTYEWSGQGSYTPVPVYDGSPDPIDAPTNLQWVNNQRLLTWDAPAQQVVTYIIYVDDVRVGNSPTTSYELNLPNGNYQVAVIPQGLFTRGGSATRPITISDIVFTDYPISQGNGFISITPPPVDNGNYEYRWGDDPDFNNSQPGIAGSQYDIPHVAGQTYYLWVRYIVAGIATDWVRQIVEGIPTRDIAEVAANASTITFNGYELEAKIVELQARLNYFQNEYFDRQSRQEQLTDAVVSIDATSGQIINRAFDYSENRFTEASLLIDGVKGEITAAVERIEQTESEITGLSADFNLLPGQITQSVEALTQSVDGLNLRLVQAEQDIDATEAAITQRVTVTDYNNNTVTFSNVESTLNGIGSYAAIQAQYQQFEDDGTLIKANEAALFINGQTGTIQQLISSVDVGGDVTALIDRVEQVETDSEGNASAISALDGQVNNGTNGLAASYTLAQQADIKAGENAASITVIENTVNHPSSGLAATNTIAQQASTQAGNNATSITNIQSSVSNANNNANSALSLATSIDNEIEDIRAVALLYVQANGRMAAVGLNASPNFTGIDFQSDELRWLDQSGNPKVYWNGSNFVFDGEIQARSGRFSGQVVQLGTAYMILEDPNGFGPDGLIYYFGPKYLSGSDPNYSQATKANASFWMDSAGQSYFGGSLNPSIIINPARSTVITLNPTLELGPFSTDGNNKQVQFAFSYNGYYEEPDGGSSSPPSPANPFADITLQRKIGSGSWTTVIGPTRINGTIDTTDLNEPGAPEWILSESLSGSFSYTDTSSSTDNFMYRVLITNQSRYLSTSHIQNQNLSVISTEE